jgi:hypothetical protein
MKLVRMDGGRIGLFVMLPNGPHAVDIANSLGVFPHDPLSNGLLNGALKDGHDWSIIVKHWVHLRWPLKKLQNIALATPDTPRLVLQPLHAHRRRDHDPYDAGHPVPDQRCRRSACRG